jgi:hypothetical protein
LLDLQQEKGHEAVPYLDAFAKAQRLVADKSHPIAPRYQLFSGKHLLADLTLVIGVGEFGAQLTLFEFEPSMTAELRASFDSFVTGEIATAFPTRRCAEVDGYSNPIAYR